MCIRDSGVVCMHKPGDYVTKGEPILELHGDKEDCFDSAIDALEGAIEISDSPPDELSLIIDKISI